MENSYLSRKILKSGIYSMTFNKYMAVVYYTLIRFQRKLQKVKLRVR
jgi:hypothetical protein